MNKAAILVEGKTDKDFIRILLDVRKLNKDKVKFFSLGNKSNFFKKENDQYKELLLDIEQEEIEKSLFILDADDVKNDAKYGGYDNTKKELINIIDVLKIKNNDIYIMCDPATKIGYLESLILSSISEEQKQCIDNFISCSKFKSKENHKSILHQIYKMAYPHPQASYNFSHPNFAPLKQKLTELFQ